MKGPCSKLHCAMKLYEINLWWNDLCFFFCNYTIKCLHQLSVRPSQNSKMYESMLAEHQLVIRCVVLPGDK